MKKIYFFTALTCASTSLFGAANNTLSCSADWHEAPPGQSSTVKLDPHLAASAQIVSVHRPGPVATEFSRKLITVNGTTKCFQLLMLATENKETIEKVFSAIDSNRQTELELKDVNMHIKKTCDASLAFFTALFTFKNNYKTPCTFKAGNEKRYHETPIFCFHSPDGLRRLRGIEYIKVDPKTLKTDLFYGKYCQDVSIYVGNDHDEYLEMPPEKLDIIADRREAFLHDPAAQHVIFKVSYPAMAKFLAKHRESADCTVL